MKVPGVFEWLITLVVLRSIELMERNPGVRLPVSRWRSLREKQEKMYRRKWERNTPLMQQRTMGLRQELRKERMNPTMRHTCQKVLYCSLAFG